MPGVEAVAGAGEVLVVAEITVEQTVVGGVVDAAEVQGGAEVIALGGVVVDHVEDDLDPGLVEGAHHGLELADRAAGMLVGGILGVGGEKAERVVAPVVSQPQVEQTVVVEELVDRHQLDRGHVQRLEVIDDRRMRQPGIRAAQLVGDAGVRLGHALDMGFVDHRLVIGRARRAVGAPLEEGVDHDAGHRVSERVDLWRRAAGDEVVGLQVVGVQRLAEREVTVEGLAVGIEQELAGIAPVSGRRAPGPVYPVSVALARGHRGQIAVPDEAVDLVELDAVFAAVLADQAQLDPFGDLGEQREVRSRSVVRGTQRIGVAGPDSGDGRRTGRRHQSVHQPVTAAI